MKTITIQFNKGVQPPLKIGTLQLKPTAEGFLAYAQNIDQANDEYGTGLVLPGPALTSITNESQLTGVPFYKAIFTSDASLGFEAIILAEAILGATNKLRVVTGVKDSGTLTISTTNKTVTHNDTGGVDTGHTGIVVHDIMEWRDNGGNVKLIISGADATDNFVMKVAISSGLTPVGTPIQLATPSSRAGHRIKLFAGQDNKIHVSIGASPATITTIDPDGTVTAAKFTMPQGKAITAFGNFNIYQAIAYSTAQDGSFATRKAAASSGILLWDLVTATSFVRDVPIPTNFISAIVTDPFGSTLVFGGLDQGKTTLFEFNGYGVTPLVSYIGDMPFSSHSVTFDSEGRILWQTYLGHLMRFDRRTKKLEHLGTGNPTADVGYGGALCKLLGGTGNDFLMLGGSDSSPSKFTAKKVIFGSYTGDGAGGDTVNTPIAVSGTEIVPIGTTVSNVALYLSRALQTGEKAVLRIYENGSTTGTDLITMDFTTDGAISAKKEVLTRPDLNNFALGLVFKQADGATTAPPVATAVAELENTQ